MYKKKQLTVIVLVSLITWFFLLGCIQTLTLLSVPVTALQLGTTAYQSIEKADVDAAVISGGSEIKLKNIKTIAVFLGQESTEPPLGRIGDLGAVVGDNLCVELTKLGFTIRDGSRLQKATVNELANAGYSNRRVAKIGRALGVQAILTGNVTAGQNRSFGMLGVGRMNTVVQSATMKIIDARKANTLMLVTINYKVGQGPHVAAEGIAMVLKAKLDDPKADVKEVMKAEKKMVGLDDSRFSSHVM
ncbi:MAG: hypothetical protein JXC33_00565 [Deltaproteobacteria bacterium]|nr:hypothetical protein [Deltaproteobacteria bacterium]